MMPKKTQFAKPVRGLTPADAPKDRLSQFMEVRSAFYHLSELIKEFEGNPGTSGRIFARAAARLSKAANTFADGIPESIGGEL